MKKPSTYLIISLLIICGVAFYSLRPKESTPSVIFYARSPSVRPPSDLNPLEQVRALRSADAKQDALACFSRGDWRLIASRSEYFAIHGLPDDKPVFDFALKHGLKLMAGARELSTDAEFGALKRSYEALFNQSLYELATK
jgi:hypothetical protein